MGEVRYKLVIEYEGSGFHGWYRQQGLPSVQGIIESALSKLFGRHIAIFGAGRTDAGVHAFGQVAHFDIDICHHSCNTILRAANFYLRNDDISILSVTEVSKDFDSRHSALSKIYEYRIINRKVKVSMERGRVWWFGYPLDLDLMIHSSSFLIGKHDFSSFRDSACQAKGAVRTLDAFSIEKKNDLVVMKVRSRSFLHKQVRIMVGTIVGIGAGRITLPISEILAKRDRRCAGITAPPYGLYLKEVFYGNH